MEWEKVQIASETGDEQEGKDVDVEVEGSNSNGHGKEKDKEFHEVGKLRQICSKILWAI
jgi:hypothetical protein